jgi:CheY-like chemotaxis protein
VQKKTIHVQSTASRLCINTRLILKASQSFFMGTELLSSGPAIHEDPPLTKMFCCVVDIAMPVKDGIAVMKEIRQFEQESKLPRVRIAALTWFSSEKYQKNAFMAGVDMFLIKPVSMKAPKPILEVEPRCCSSALKSFLRMFWGNGPVEG